MPFCTKCGQQVGAADVFCSNCGLAQNAGAQSAGAQGANSQGTSGAAGSRFGTGNGPKDFAADMNPRSIAALCYVPVLGWIASLYVLAGERFRNDQTVRFHAFQGLYLFVAWLVLDWAIGPLIGGWYRIAGLLKGALGVLGIFMLLKTLRNQDERLPFVGDLAERSVREQR